MAEIAWFGMKADDEEDEDDDDDDDGVAVGDDDDEVDVSALPCLNESNAVFVGLLLLSMRDVSVDCRLLLWLLL